MKKLITLVILFLTFTINAQRTDYIYLLLNDSISKDDFLIKQKYHDFKCGGFIFPRNESKEMSLENWFWSIDFKHLNDTSVYIVEYEMFPSCFGIMIESLKVYDKSNFALVRELLFSYSSYSSTISQICDTKLD